LVLDLGAATLVVSSPAKVLASQIQTVYPAFPVETPPQFTDFRIALQWPRWRRVIRPQVALYCDGLRDFHPFPSSHTLPLLEWGTNWLIGQRMNHLLLFHAGSLERDGLGLLLPAVPGSGKSTLTAALAHRGWRLLSDEFGVCEPETGHLLAMLKPIALKNESIDVICGFAPEAVIGPRFPKTRKGTVAHVAASADAVARRHEPARPALVVLPQWTAGSATRLEPIDDEAMFRALAFNAFNYEVLGATGFRAVLRIVRQCRGWRLEYSNLDEAVAALDGLWRDAAAAAGTPAAAAEPTAALSE
jgi:HprK-related kinase A